MLIFDQLRKNDSPLRFFAFTVLAGLILLAANLWRIQVLASGKYVEKMQDQSLKTVRVPAIRGRILDRHGVALAENRAAYNVNLYIGDIRRAFDRQYRESEKRALESRASQAVVNVPEQGWWANLKARLSGNSSKKPRLTAAEKGAIALEARKKAATQSIQSLANILQEPIQFDAQEFQRHYLTRRFLPMPIMRNLNPGEIARFEEHAINPVGLELEMQATRFYPQGTTNAHLLGFVKLDNESMANEVSYYNYRLDDYKGVVGLEGFYDTRLRGQPGVKHVQVNNVGYRHSDTLWPEDVPGKNIVLTIDLTIQTAATAALRSNPVFGADVRGAVVVLDARNCDILALVSNPAFDPNWYVQGLTKDQAAFLSDDRIRPQANRATREIYAPGSIFKIISGLAALENGLDPKAITRVSPDPAKPDKGAYFVGRRKIRDTAAPGDYDFRLAFIKSSNSYFIEHGLKQVGIEKLLEMGHRFHLGERLDLPLLQNAAGVFPTMDDLDEQKRNGNPWTDGNTANICFGQEIAVTPMQMAVMTAAVANGGKIYWPRLVQRIEPQEALPNQENEISEFPVRFRNDLGVQQKNLQIIRDAMKADVADSDGTGTAAAVPGMNVSGKTGTAQVLINNAIRYYTWFASFAPHENPRYVVLVMVEDGSSGGGTCAPIAKKIYEAIKRLDETSPSTNRKLAINN